jgi:hypothetical protein
MKNLDTPKKLVIKLKLENLLFVTMKKNSRFSKETTKPAPIHLCWGMDSLMRFNTLH